MAGTSFSTTAISATNVSLTDKDGYALFGDCVGAPDTTAGIYQHGCLMIRNNTSTGSVAVYQNTGSIASPVWTAMDTSLPGDTASSLVDTNNVVVVGLTTVASTVNGLLITGSATGAVSANAVTIAPGAASGSDSAISLTLTPKGATGILTIGAIAQTGVINVGIATTAATAGVNILSANGTASTQTIEIGGGTSTTSGGKVVNIANGVPGASTTNTVAIGTGGTTTGTVGVTIGSNGNAAHTTTIQGGSGATTAIVLTPQTTGGIVIGAAAGTGAITVGSSSAAQTVNIGNGAGVSTVNIAVNGATGNVVNIGTGAIAGTITIGNTTGATAVAYLAGSGKHIFTGVINATSPVFVTPVLGAATGTSMSLTGGDVLKNATAVPATAGAVAAGAPITMYSSSITVEVTSDVPTHTRPKGSICINTGGGSTTTRMYVNTDGAGTWTAFTTSA